MPSSTSVKSKSSKSKNSSSKHRSSSVSSTGGSGSTSPLNSTSRLQPEPISSQIQTKNTNSLSENLAKAAVQRRGSNLSAQSIKYKERDGVIQVKEVEGTTLDSDEYYEYLYEDLIDAEGATASKLVSRETVHIQFDEDQNEMCNICHVKFADCPHLPESTGSIQTNVEDIPKPAAKTRSKKK